MKSTRKTSRAADLSAADDGTGRELVKRSRPNQLLRKLRNAQRHRQAEIARPPTRDGGSDEVLMNTTSPAALWSQRGVMLALVPLSIVGMATLFVLGFIGSKQVVGYLVGEDYVPVALNSDERQSAEVAPSVTAPPASPPDSARTTTGDTVDEAPSGSDTPVVVDRSEPSEATSLTSATDNPTSAPPTPSPAEEDVDETTGVDAVPADYQPPDYDGIAAMESEGPALPAATDIVARDVAAPAEEPATPPETQSEVVAVTTRPAPQEEAVDPAPASAPIATEAPRAETVAAEPVQSETEPEEAPVEVAEASVKAEVPAAVEAPAEAEEAAPVARTVIVAEPSEGEPTADTAAKAEEEPQTRRDRDDESDELKNRQVAEAPPEPEVEGAAQLIGRGHTLMTSGQISEARQLFTKGLATGSAEAALALGRSYDPKHLASIGADPSLADPAVARKWYAEWYRRSVEQGAISQNVKLERLLQAMNLN